MPSPKHKPRPVPKAPLQPRSPPCPAKLEIVDQKVGTGPAIANGQTAVVHYTGWLYDQSAPEHKGTKFDSSRDRDEPFSFELGQGHVIAGLGSGRRRHAGRRPAPARDSGGAGLRPARRRRRDSAGRDARVRRRAGRDRVERRAPAHSQHERRDLAGPAGALEALHRNAARSTTPRRSASASFCIRIRCTAARWTTRWSTRSRARSRSSARPTIRFNFRGVGASDGQFADGIGETDDALAVIAAGRERWPGAQLWLGGLLLRWRGGDTCGGERRSPHAWSPSRPRSTRVI